MRRITFEIVLLAFVSAVVAVAVNELKPEPFPLRVPAGFYGIESPARPLLVAGARRLYKEGRSVFIDARPAADYETGQIKGALNVPFDRWEELYPALEPWIAHGSIILYAGEEQIRLADDLAGALASRGHADSLFIFLGGVDAWGQAGLPISTGPDATLGETQEGEEW